MYHVGSIVNYHAVSFLLTCINNTNTYHLTQIDTNTYHFTQIDINTYAKKLQRYDRKTNMTHWQSFKDQIDTKIFQKTKVKFGE